MSPSPSVTIGLNNSITVNMSDSNGIQSAVLELMEQWHNITNLNKLNRNSKLVSLGQLFQGLTDGTVTANLIVTDNLGKCGNYFRDFLEDLNISTQSLSPYLETMLDCL